VKINPPISLRTLVVVALALTAIGFALRAHPAKADAFADLVDAYAQRRGVIQRPAGALWRASWYGAGRVTALEPSRYTASGERFNRFGLTAAHRTLPFGTLLRVCFRGCAVVRVNDRGPARWTGRSLDLSKGAAIAVGLHDIGSAAVRVAVISR